MGEIPRVERPYLPMVAAVDAHELDLDKATSHRLSEPLGVTLAHGEMPYHRERSLFDSPRGIIACDHAHLVALDNGQMIVAPSSRDDVSKADGAIQSEGIIILSTPDGWLKIVGEMINHLQSPWEPRQNPVNRHSGPFALRSFGLEAPEGTISEIESGILVAKLRR